MNLKLTLNLGCGERVFKRYPDESHTCINYDERDDLPYVDVVGDARKLCFNDNHFDYILASDIIEHFPIKETNSLVNEWRRVLKPGGILEIRTPSLDLLCSGYLSGDSAKTISKHMFGGQQYPGNFHYVCFDKKWLNEKIEPLGFRCIGCEFGGDGYNMTLKYKKVNYE